MIRLDQSGVKASGEKSGIPEQSENITEREKSCGRSEKKSVARRSEQIERKEMCNIAEQAV